MAFVYILFISLAALLSGMLNAMGRFSRSSAAAPIIALNLILIRPRSCWPESGLIAGATLDVATAGPGPRRSDRVASRHAAGLGASKRGGRRGRRWRWSGFRRSGAPGSR